MCPCRLSRTVEQLQSRWTEDLVVSQVADFKNGRVTAFMTWPDKDARRDRAELLHKGTLTVLEA